MPTELDKLLVSADHAAWMLDMVSKIMREEGRNFIPDIVDEAKGVIEELHRALREQAK